MVNADASASSRKSSAVYCTDVAAGVQSVVCNRTHLLSALDLGQGECTCDERARRFGWALFGERGGGRCYGSLGWVVGADSKVEGVDEGCVAAGFSVLDSCPPGGLEKVNYLE